MYVCIYIYIYTYIHTYIQILLYYYRAQVEVRGVGGAGPAAGVGARLTHSLTH